MVWENNGGEGKEYFFSDFDKFGVACFIPLNTFSLTVESNGLGIIVKKPGTWEGQTGDVILNFDGFSVDEDGYYNVYINSEEEKLFNNPDFVSSDEIEKGLFLLTGRLKVETTNLISECTLYKNDGVVEILTNVDKDVAYFEFEDLPDFTASYKVGVKFKDSGATLKSSVSFRYLFSTEMLDEAYYYDGELGAIYTKSKTIFKVWSPVSSKIELRVYENGTPTSVDATIGSDEYTFYTMEKGVFSVEVNGDLGTPTKYGVLSGNIRASALFFLLRAP